MSKPKQIAWESWNAKIEEMTMSQEILPPEMDIDELTYSEMEIPPELMPQEIFIQPQRILYTPLGAYPEESQLKPSDRWDCWLAYTNFDITNDIAEIIEDIHGIEALRVLGRYSFFVGVGKLFDIKDVRIRMEKELCAYSEQEILSDENTQATVDLVKEQLMTKKYWSMLVSPAGDVEYIVSDKMDRIYLEDLNKLLERKQNVGGIILRGNDG